MITQALGDLSGSKPCEQCAGPKLYRLRLLQ